MSRRRGVSLALIGAVLTLSGCATSQTAEVERIRARAAYERGLASLADRQPGLALSALQEAIAADPTVPRYHDSLGILYLGLGQIDQAVERFRKAIELDPKFADAHFHLGTALAEVRRWEDAVTSYRTALALPTLTVPDYANQNLGLALFHLKRYREAEQALRLAIGLDPELQGAYYHLGLVLIAENRREEAKAAFRQTRKLGPDTTFGRAARDRLKDLGEEG